jgi:hypothetical protein
MGRKFVVDLKHWYYRTIINPAEQPGSRMGSLMGDEPSIPESKSTEVMESDDCIEVGTQEAIGR